MIFILVLAVLLLLIDECPKLFVGLLCLPYFIVMGPFMLLGGLIEFLGWLARQTDRTYDRSVHHGIRILKLAARRAGHLYRAFGL